MSQKSTTDPTQTLPWDPNPNQDTDEGPKNTATREATLDETLESTFPASDAPSSLPNPEPAPTPRDQRAEDEPSAQGKHSTRKRQ